MVAPWQGGARAVVEHSSSACWAGSTVAASPTPQPPNQPHPLPPPPHTHCQRPTADEALRHPFLSGGREGVADRGAGRPLDKQVVQRIQVRAADAAAAGVSGRRAACGLKLSPNSLHAPTRHTPAQRFAQSSLFKRTVLEHMAADLLSMHFEPDPSTHGGSGALRACRAVPRAPRAALRLPR